MLFPKLRPDVASGTSRRDNRRVTTQRQIRRDVISDTSCPDSSEPHLNYRKCFNNDMQYLVMCVSVSAFIPCIIQKSSNSWLNKCCYCFFHRSGSKSLYFSSGVFGCHSMVFSMTSLMYSNRLMPFNLHEIAIEYRIAPRLAPSCEPKNIEFLLDSDMYLWILSM